MEFIFGAFLGLSLGWLLIMFGAVRSGPLEVWGLGFLARYRYQASRYGPCDSFIRYRSAVKWAEAVGGGKITHYTTGDTVWEK